MAQTARIKLSKLYDEFIGAYESLKNITERKQDAIFDRDFDELESLTEKQQALTEQLETIDEKKSRYAENYLETPGQLEDVTLETLKDAAGVDKQDDLSEKHRHLKQLIRDVQRYSRENQRLLETRQDFFEKLFNEFKDGQPGETYDKNKKKDESGADEAVIFDEAI
ncbi:MAG: flagellar protein FlgN [bacterium]